MNIRFYLFALVGCITLASGCSSDDNKKVVQPPVVVKKPDFVEPFRFHKLIEVSPGQDYDVMSWGRGSTVIGGFLILHSDSAARNIRPQRENLTAL